ncbi:nuclear pore complex protein Nup85, partial [Clarias magur]
SITDALFCYELSDDCMTRESCWSLTGYRSSPVCHVFIWRAQMMNVAAPLVTTEGDSADG